MPTIIERPKWFEENKGVSVGDIVLFLKSEQEFDSIYQYGIVQSMQRGRDDKIRTIGHTQSRRVNLVLILIIYVSLLLSDDWIRQSDCVKLHRKCVC